MKRLMPILLILVCFGCTEKPQPKVAIIPQPASIENAKGTFVISEETSICILQEELMPVAKLLQKNILLLSKIELAIITAKTDNCILLSLEEGFEQEEYKLTISDDIIIVASNYNAVALGVSSLVQLMKPVDGEIWLAKLTITDKPDYEYRTVMIDLARFWHPVETVKETIDLLWFYKSNYLHLHLSDNSRFTFPLEEFPELKRVNENGTREYYTLEELNDLVEYAKQRGIAIIPEIDLPGHSGQMWSKYPEVFGSIDPKTNEAKPLYVVNMAKEETYHAIEKIIQKLAEVFYTSPYIHFGGDEVYLEVLKSVPEYKPYCQQHNLQEALDGNAQELFCHFINRLHEMVKATGKKTIIWEGFPDSGAGSVIINKDIEVIVWNTSYNHPQNLLDNGYKIVNSTWIPWYLVGAMNLSAPQDIAYDWDLTQWSHWNANKKNMELDSKKGVFGGQICFWEQNHYKVIPELKPLVPVFSERLWNNNSPSSFEEFAIRYENTKSIYKKLFRPIKFEISNLISQDDKTFLETAEINLKSDIPGKIKYVYSDSWELPEMNSAELYNKPIIIDKSGILTIQLFDNNEVTVGYPVQKYFQKIVPAYHYKVYGRAPQHGWTEMPDFSQLEVIREGASGFMTPERLGKINGELFAKVKREGHIEVRFNKIYNPYAVELTGTINCSKDADYEFRIQTHDGLAELYIDDKLVGKGENFKNEPEDFTINLKSGTHSITIKYFYKQIQNQLSIMYKTDEMEDFKPFEQLVQPIQ